MGGESRSRIGYHILQTALMHGYDIGISFNHIDAVFFDNSFLGLIDTVELPLLMVNLRIGGVDILLLYALGGCIELSSAKGYHLAADIEPGEDGTACKAVVEAALVLDG